MNTLLSQPFFIIPPPRLSPLTVTLSLTAPDPRPRRHTRDSRHGAPGIQAFPLRLPHSGGRLAGGHRPLTAGNLPLGQRICARSEDLQGRIRRPEELEAAGEEKGGETVLRPTDLCGRNSRVFFGIVSLLSAAAAFTLIHMRPPIYPYLLPICLFL